MSKKKQTTYPINKMKSEKKEPAEEKTEKPENKAKSEKKKPAKKKSKAKNKAKKRKNYFPFELHCPDKKANLWAVIWLDGRNPHATYHVTPYIKATEAEEVIEEIKSKPERCILHPHVIRPAAIVKYINSKPKKKK